MATWTSAHGNIPNTVKCLTDGVNIYGHHSFGGFTILKYEPLNGDAQTTIGSGTPVGQNTAWGDPLDQLFWFKGNLYNMKHEAYPAWDSRLRADVYRWEGGTSWTLVESITPTSIYNDPDIDFTVSPAEINLFINRYYTNEMMAVVVETREAFPHTKGPYIYTRYTTDGANWYTSLIPDISVAQSKASIDNYHSQFGVFEKITYSGTARVMEFTPADKYFVERASPFASTLDVTDRKFVWKTGYQYSSDGITFTSPTDTAVMPISANTVQPIGAKYTGGTLYLKLWDPGASDWQAATTEVINVSAVGVNSSDNFIRLEEGSVFAHVWDGGVEFWKTRSDPLGGPPDEEDPYSPGKFYYGKGELIRRADPPMPGTAIDGMAQVGKRFYIGSKVPNDVMVARATHPFESWGDVSAGLGSTGVKSFSGTPWADAEDQEGDKDPGDEGFAGGPGGKCT
jgi:hypothetical protein